MWGPLFPRLHVYDTAKGGPRATPRNKMVLYKYLVFPLNGSIPGYGGGRERTVFSSYYIPPPAPHHFGEEIHTRSGHVVQNRNPRVMQFIMHMLLPQLKEYLPREG
ncbi:hypothetical protein MKW92_043171 [Papaver armeniacum]|nr:hypothetical protein MKW92_043171 [Papaver armeniacum]